MEKIILKKFGPISDLELEIKQLTVLTGPQTSGKSTVAKSVYFFKSIPNIFLNFLLNYKKIFSPNQTDFIEFVSEHFQNLWSKNYYSENTVFKYFFDNEIDASITFENLKPTFEVHKKINDKIQLFFKNHDFSNHLFQLETNLENYSKIDLIKIVQDIFGIVPNYDAVYIPAGRSSLLKIDKFQKEYMTKNQKNENFIDYFSDYYLNEFANRINPEISFLTGKNIDFEKKADDLIEKLMNGKLKIEENKLTLTLNTNIVVNLNELSSGQEEIIWLATILKQFIVNNIEKFVVVEEPETNLYPESQKDIVMLIALFLNSNSKNQLILNTHSAYVLSVINNLLLAKRKHTETENKTVVENIISNNFWLDLENTTAILFNPKENKIEDCINREHGYIRLKSVDNVADEINDLFYNLSEIE